MMSSTMDRIKDSSWVVRIVFPVLCISALLLVVGLALPSWYEVTGNSKTKEQGVLVYSYNYKVKVGLWTSDCTGDVSTVHTNFCTDVIKYKPGTWQTVSGIIVVIALLVEIGLIGLLAGYVAFPDKLQNKGIVLAMMAMCFLSAVLIVAGMIYFGVSMSPDSDGIQGRAKKFKPPKMTNSFSFSSNESNEGGTSTGVLVASVSVVVNFVCGLVLIRELRNIPTSEPYRGLN